MSHAVAFIDWVSYTRANDVNKLEYPSEFAGCAREVVFEFQRLSRKGKDGFTHTSPVKPNRPFADARMDMETKARIEWGGGSDRVLISFSGEGCRHLRQTERTNTLLSTIAGDVSRIDLSVDFETTITPKEFCALRDKARHKTGAYMFSEEGETQYVGSWSSDSFARVYRYNPPHERSHLLRAEHVFKGKKAKALAAKLVDHRPSALLESATANYGWTHALFLEACSQAKTPEQVAWYKEEGHASKTLKWLNETCAPAIIRMVQEGEISNASEWFDHLVLEPLYNDGRDAQPGASKLGG